MSRYPTKLISPLSLLRTHFKTSSRAILSLSKESAAISLRLLRRTRNDEGFATRFSTFRVLKSSRGISIITILIIAAFVVAAFNAYAYFNPKFQLSKYSIVYLLHAGRDKQRVADLKKIQGALERYYSDHGAYPAWDGWCGPIYYAFDPEVTDALTPYLGDNGVPRDPGFRENEQNYFYRRENSRSYVLMAVLDNPPAGSVTYNYSGCHNWPGDGVYNYRLVVSR